MRKKVKRKKSGASKKLLEKIAKEKRREKNKKNKKVFKDGKKNKRAINMSLNLGAGVHVVSML